MPSWGVVTTITMTKDGLHLSYPAKVIRNPDACYTIKHVSLNTRDARPTMGHASSPTLPLYKRTVYRARWQTATKSSPPLQNKTLKSQPVIRQKKPTTARLIREAYRGPEVREAESVDEAARWIWDYTLDFEREGYTSKTPGYLFQTMTPEMQKDMRRLV